ncbi:MAG: hypothetical protein K7J15_03055, partial [Candidatus Regiella insecticola]|nr:hypothetical protein [Candidatus Regiella insecticola]
MRGVGGTKRAAELEENGVPNSSDIEKITVGELLKRYINDPNLGGKAGHTKRYVTGHALRLRHSRYFTFRAFHKLRYR